MFRLLILLKFYYSVGFISFFDIGLILWKLDRGWWNINTSEKTFSIDFNQTVHSFKSWIIESFKIAIKQPKLNTVDVFNSPTYVDRKTNYELGSVVQNNLAFINYRVSKFITAA
jgi:hypothetical protein